MCRMKGNDMYARTNHFKSLACAIVAALAILVACNSTPPPSQQARPEAQEQQVPIPTTAAEVSGPVAGTLMTKEYVQMVGRTAYFWGYPIVATSSRRDAFAKAPERIYLGGFLPMAPIGDLTMLHDYISPEQTFIVCPNQDVVYGGGFAALEKEPMVFQVPDFGRRFWVYPIYDNRTDEIGRIGQQYGTKPGFYMIVGPNWNGKVPEGITAIVRSSTDLAFVIPRIQMDDTAEDKQAIQAPLSQVMMYPLSQFDGKMKTTDWSKIPSVPVPAGPPNKWVNPETYFEQLPAVLKQVPALPGEQALYAQISAVFEAAAKDPALKQALVESFASAQKELVDPLWQWRYNGIPAGNGWTTLKNGAEFGSDYYTRTAVAYTNIYVNVPPEAVSHNGLEMIEEAMRLRPDIIVADISMPGLDGIEAAHRLREMGARATIVFLTIHESPEFVEACLAEGALGYVVKSQMKKDLIPAINAALSGQCFVSSTRHTNT